MVGGGSGLGGRRWGSVWGVGWGLGISLLWVLLYLTFFSRLIDRRWCAGSYIRRTPLSVPSCPSLPPLHCVLSDSNHLHYSALLRSGAHPPLLRVHLDAPTRSLAPRSLAQLVSIHLYDAFRLVCDVFVFEDRESTGSGVGPCGL